jgi:hypothetical protein
MNSYRITSRKKILVNTGLLALSALIMIVMSGCFKNYGRLNRSSEIQNAFESNQVPSDYRYFFYGSRNWPYAVMGLGPDYNLHSRMWRSVEPDTTEFKHMTRFVWADYGYYPYGANILDPEGQKIGIIYTSSWMAAVKVDKDNKTVEVMPHIFLGGP